MSLLKQALLCLVLFAAAGAGWYLYQNPELAGLAREAGSGREAGAQAGGPPGGQGQGRGQGRRPEGGGNRIPGLMGGGGAVNVVTARVETDAGGETVTALGTAKAARSVTLFPQVTGVVTEVLFTPGQAVDAGAILLRLEDDEQQVAVDKARVTLKQTQDALTRAQALGKSKTITAVALSEAETAAQLAEIEVRTADIELERRSIKAPFAGVTGMTDLSLGDLVTSSTAITTLEDTAAIRIAFEVPERWAGRIGPDQPIAAAAQGVPGSQFTGRIVGVDNRIDATTRTLRLEAELANDRHALKTGMAINVTLRFDTAQQLAVPTLSVQWDRRGSFVWKVVESAAKRADIAILRRESGIVLVQGDLQAGDAVVVEGIQRLREGAKVAEVGAEPGNVRPPELRDGIAPTPDNPPAVSARERTPARS